MAVTPFSTWLRILPTVKRLIPMLVMKLAAVRRRSWGVKDTPDASQMAAVGFVLLLTGRSDVGLGNIHSLLPELTFTCSRTLRASSVKGTRWLSLFFVNSPGIVHQLVSSATSGGRIFRTSP